MIKNVLPSLRQRAGPQRICSRQKASAAALPVTPSRKPRMCGEKSGLPVSVPTRMGSPPRMRGKGGILGVQRNCPRITPACAGKRFLLRLSGCLLQDHPRMCGEKERDPDICINCPGSPPHVRGKVSGFCTILRPLGITPACAGKSCQTNYWLHSCRDHPRMCGEKWLARFSPFATMGSPPRMRGKETMENTQAKRTGITPAYAGKR